MKADAVRLKEPVTRLRGARIHETPEPFTLVTPLSNFFYYVLNIC